MAFRLLALLQLVVVVPLLFVTHTFRDATAISFIMLVSLAGLLMRRKTAAPVVAVIGLCAIILVGAFGYLQPDAPVQLGLVDLLLILIGLLLNTALVCISWGSGPEREESVQQMAAALAVTTRELEAAQTQLRQTQELIEQRVAEQTAALAEANRQLIDEVWTRQQSEARLRHLYEETLQLAKQNAEAADRTKSEFLANVSHEIRTPMNSVIGMASLLQATELTEQQRSYVEWIRRSSDALLTMIDDILDLAKAESGKLRIERQPFNLHQAIEEVLELLAPKAVEKDLELIYSIDRSVPVTVLGDVARLRQVLINVIANAIKFTQRGEVSLTVKAQSVADEQVVLHFAVQDTGIGIAPEHVQQLFQPFSQAEASNTRRFGGTGIGLVISKRLCELMGGNIWVESQQHVGTTAHFTIIAPVVEATGEQTGYGIHPALAGRTVLIVDDNRTVRQVLQQMTRGWGMIPTAVASSAKALALVQEQTRFDIAVIDMQMPGMSGLALAKELRKLVADLPIVMTSALGMPMYAAGEKSYLHELPIVLGATLGSSDSHEAVRQLGVKSILNKPIRPSALRAAFLEYLDIDETGDQAGRLDEPSPLRESNESIEWDMGRRYPLQILVVEDNPVNQKVALRMLKRLGYDADVAVNGLEAIRVVRESRYDVLLMDVQMPEMDGLEATRQIRVGLPASEQPYIIAMTAAAMQLDREKCLEAGMDDFIAKPARVEDLAQALNRYLLLFSRARCKL